jgi:hypothetical protein
MAKKAFWAARRPASAGFAGVGGVGGRFGRIVVTGRRDQG